MIQVQWHPRWEAAEMLQMHPVLQAHVQAYEQERPEQQTADPSTKEIDLDNLVKQGFDGNPQSLANSPWLSTTGCAINMNVIFDFQPTNPQTNIMPTWKCEIIIRTVELLKQTQQRDPYDEATVPAQMPELFTCESAFIYNTNGKCVGMLTIERLQSLLEAYEAAKKAGKHTTIQPPVQSTATEIMGLLARQKAQQKQLSAKSKKVHNSNALIIPPHI
eukprot:1136589-Pelagomonas_calceolata.AAC.2